MYGNMYPCVSLYCTMYRAWAYWYELKRILVLFKNLNLEKMSNDLFQFLYKQHLKIKKVKSWVLFDVKYFQVNLSLCHKFIFCNPYIFATWWYFKLTLYDLTAFIVWNIKGLWLWVATILKLEIQSLWQKLNSFIQWFVQFSTLVRAELTELSLFLHNKNKNHLCNFF